MHRYDSGRYFFTSIRRVLGARQKKSVASAAVPRLEEIYGGWEKGSGVVPKTPGVTIEHKMGWNGTINQLDVKA